MRCGEMAGAVSFPASSMHEGGEPFCYPCLAFKQRGLGRESRPWDPGTHTIHRQAVAYTSVLLFSPHRFLQRLEKVHRAPCASETHRRKAQVRPQAESHPREGPAELRWPTKWHGGWQRSMPCHVQPSPPREIPRWWVAGGALPLPLAYSSLSPPHCKTKKGLRCRQAAWAGCAWPEPCLLLTLPLAYSYLSLAYSSLSPTGTTAAPHAATCCWWPTVIWMTLSRSQPAAQACEEGCHSGLPGRGGCCVCACSASSSLLHTFCRRQRTCHGH